MTQIKRPGIDNLSPTAQRILDYIKEHPGLSRLNIEQALDLSHAVVTNATATLSAYGMIGRQTRIPFALGRGRDRAWLFYAEVGE